MTITAIPTNDSRQKTQTKQNNKMRPVLANPSTNADKRTRRAYRDNNYHGQLDHRRGRTDANRRKHTGDGRGNGRVRTTTDNCRQLNTQRTNSNTDFANRLQHSAQRPYELPTPHGHTETPKRPSYDTMETAE